MHSKIFLYGHTLLCAVGLMLPTLTAAQTGPAADSASLATAVTAELGHLASRSSTIFVGQLVGIQRVGSVVEVTFRVEQPVRGIMSDTLVLREWAGNWAPGQSRYVVGARVLAFLQGTSAAGLSSPVHGAEGLVPVVVQGANAPRLLDVRRVAASVPRLPGVPLPTEADGAVLLDTTIAALASGNAPSNAHVPLPVHGRLPNGFRFVTSVAGVAEDPGISVSTSERKGATDARR